MSEESPSPSPEKKSPLKEWKWVETKIKLANLKESQILRRCEEFMEIVWIKKECIKTEDMYKYILGIEKRENILPPNFAQLSPEDQSQITKLQDTYNKIWISISNQISLAMEQQWDEKTKACGDAFISLLQLAHNRLTILEQVSAITHQTNPQAILLYQFVWELWEEWIEWIANHTHATIDTKTLQLAWKERINTLAEKKFEELWWEQANKLASRWWSPAKIEVAKKSFQTWSKTTEIGKDLMRQCLRIWAWAVPLFIMGLYIHNAVDKKKALLEYGSMILMSRWAAALIWLISKAPGMAKVAAYLSKLLGKGGPIVSTALIVGTFIAVFSNPRAAENFNKAIGWVDDSIPDTVVTNGISQVLSSVDVPITWVQQIFEGVWIVNYDPAREQMTYLHQTVAREHEFLASSGNIPIKFWAWDEVGGDNIFTYWDNKILTQVAWKPLQGKLVRFYTFWDQEWREAWWKRQIPDFYGKYCLLKKQEEDLENTLKQMWAMTQNEHLSYTQMATKMNAWYGKLDTAIIKEDANRSAIGKKEDAAEEGNTMYTIKYFFTGRRLGSEDFITNKTLLQKMRDIDTKKTAQEQTVEYKNALSLWKQVRQLANDVSDDVDVYSYAGVYRDTWKTPFEDPETYQGFLDKFVWEQEQKDIIQITPGKTPEEQKREIDAIINLVPVDPSGWLAQIMAAMPTINGQNREMTDLMRSRKGIWDTLKFFIEQNVPTESINDLLKNNIANIALLGRQISSEEILQVFKVLVEYYFKNIYKKWQTVPQCIRDYIPQPADYSPSNTPPNTTDDTKIKQWYIGEIERLKGYENGANWTQLNYEIEDQKTITLSRPAFSHDTITIKQSTESHGQWVLYSKEYGALSGYLEFHQAVAMANLSLYYMEWLNNEVNTRKRREYYGGPGGGWSAEIIWDKTWKSEDGTKRPFYYKEGTWLIYAKDNSSIKDVRFSLNGDQEVMKSQENGFDWVKFYTQQLQIPSDTMVNILNKYFENIWPQLDLIGD